jgi:hypothetical protein
LTSGTTEHALAIGAELARGAFLGTRAAVIEVSFQIDANTGAIGEAGWADAFAVRTDFAAGAFIAACTAVIEVSCSIDTDIIADDLTYGARSGAFAIGAELTGSAFSAACTAVIEVISQILADTRAIVETRGADALAGRTDLAAGAFRATGSTIVGVCFGIDAGA